MVDELNIKDEMPFQAELFCPEAETIRPKMKFRPLDE